MTSVAPASATAAATSLDLSFADQGGGVGRRDVLRDTTDYFGAGGIDQPGELLQMLGDMASVQRPLPRRGHEHGALDGISNLNRCFRRDA